MKSVWPMLVAAIAACGGDETRAVDLMLVADPNVNRSEDVVGLVDSIVIVLDTEGGLYHPGDDLPSGGDVQIKDADGDDSDLELVDTMPMPNELPWIRIEQGGLDPDVSLDVRLSGLSAGGADVVARGGAQGIGLDGRVDVPFNLVPSRLPPRVADVVPGDGDVALDCVVRRVVIVFSKRIVPDSFLEEGAVAFDPGGAPQQLSVDASGRFGEAIPPPLEGDGTAVRYHLSVTTKVRDEGLRALDQVPAEAGDQSFEGDFVLTCEPGPQIPDPACGEPEPGPTPWCALGPRFECVDGMCVPTSCADATCADGTVCDPATAACEVDCRVYGPEGACAGGTPCDAATGVCIAPE